MKKKLLLALIILGAVNVPNIAIGQTEVSGTLTSDTEWNVDGSPYLVVSSVAVSSGVTLTIQPGVEVIFSQNTGISVRGNLNALGNVSDSIVFLPEDQSEYSWTGIDVRNSQGGNASFDYCTFNNAQYAINEQCCWGGLVSVSNTSFIGNLFALSGYSGDKTPVDNCYFFDNVYCLTAADKEVNNSVFDNNDYGLYNTERISVSNSTFTNHRQVALDGGRGLIYNCTIENNNIGIKAFFEGFRLDETKVFQNDSIGIILNDYDGYIPGIENSEICYNGKFNIYNNSEVDYQMPDNCFCIGSESEISETIYDGLDDINKGVVSFSPYNSDCGIRSLLADELSMCGGNLITVDAGNEEFELEYIWRNLDEDQTVSDSKVLVTDIPGTYSLQMIGETISVIDTFEIVNYQIPSSEFQTSSQICFEDTLLIEYTGNATINANYSWSFDGATIISGSGQGPYELFWGTGGTKSIVLEVSENGCTSEVTESEVFVNPEIEASFNTSQVVCEGENATITFNGTAPKSTIYNWQLDDGTIISGNDSTLIEVQWPDLGQKEISLTLEFNGCTSNTFSYAIDYNSIPSSTFTLEASAVCSEETTTVTYTGNGGTEAIYNWDFDSATILSGSGQGPYELSWATQGTKSITLEISENGCSSTSENQIEVLQTPTSNFSVQTQLCDGESAFVSYSGNASEFATYTWDFDGGAILSGEGAGPYEVSWDSFGSKTISLYVEEDGCSSITEVKQLNHSQYPSLSFKANTSSCYNENYEITFTGSNYTNLDWSFDGANIISGTGSGPYLLNWNSSGTKFINLVVSNNGCSKDSAIVVEVPEQPYTPGICMVTVDEVSSKNMLVWDYDLESVSQFGIYRETNVSGEYSLIEYVDGGISNSYIDSQSSPEQQSNRYKISSLDSCGTETELSSYHKTIHLTINKGIGTSWNLIWDGYEGFSFGTYRIYRSLDGNSFELLTEIASNLTSFTDTNVLTSDVAYQIEVITPNTCAVNEEGRVNQNSVSRSNIASNSNVLGAENPQFQLDIYPNPTFDYINLNSLAELLSYELMTLTGQIIQIGDLKEKHLIDMKGFSNGVYLLKVNSNQGITIKRIIKK